MSVNGKFDEITRKDLLECAARNNIKEASLVIDEICDAASKWPAIAEDCNVPKAMIESIYPNFQFL